MKIYVEDEHDVFYTPFTSHFITHVGQYAHFTHVKGESYVKEYKDYGRLIQPMDDANNDILEEIQEDD